MNPFTETAEKRGFRTCRNTTVGLMYAKGRARVYPNGPRASQPWASAAVHGFFYRQRNHATLDEALDAADLIYREQVAAEAGRGAEALRPAANVNRGES